MDSNDADRSAVGRPPAVAPAVALAVVVADTVSGVVDTLAQVDAVINGLMGVRAELAGEVARLAGLATGLSESGASRQLQERSLRAEVACVLRIPEGTADKLLRVGVALTNELPATLAALKAGEIGYRHAVVLVDNIDGLDAVARGALESTALPFARKLTVAKFERKVRSLRELAHPETMAARVEQAVTQREVTYTPGRDGMAWLSAYLPAAAAVAGFNRISRFARSLQQTGEQRTLRQLRADVFQDLLLDGEPAMDGPTGIRPQVFVTVPVMSLLGLSDMPAMLDGYGPIDAETARRLAATAPSFIRILTHPETGAVLSVGKDSYRVPQDLKNWLRVRDETCRFPGCSADAVFADIDHTVDWAWGGQTSHDNLAHLCKSHHALKHKTGWLVSNAKDGTLTWISPTGRSYTTEPENRMRL